MVKKYQTVPREQYEADCTAALFKGIGIGAFIGLIFGLVLFFNKC